ncbi:MAG: hypothetical protein IKQ16_10530 [Lentisphaeria bacterium]|jgi:hypothetical protein|nr:hypothetical protein [Lentisphaeria bacterium]
MPDDTAATTPFFTRDELKQFHYKCSHKLVISLVVGAVYLLGLTLFAVDKAVAGAGTQDKLLPYCYYGLGAAGYVFIVGLIALFVRRSQSLNFSRFLQGCVRFDNFGYMLEYVELRMPGPFSPRFLQYPIHLMILGKVLEHSEKPENVEVGHRMVAASADRDPALEAFRGAELADLMKFHETFLAERPEMQREWHNAESFHSLLVHLILPVVIIMVIFSLTLKGCKPPEETEERSLPAAGETQAKVSAREMQHGGTAVPDAAPERTEKAAEEAEKAEGPLTERESVPQA